MKTPKISLDQEALKEFFIKHIEKIAISLIGALSAYFLYQGFDYKTYNPDRDPLVLSTTAAEARRNVEENHWSQLSTEPERSAFTEYKSRVIAGLSETDGGNYKFGMFNTPLFPNKQKRGSVNVYTPEKLEVVSVRAAIFETPKNGDDPFAGDASAAGNRGSSKAAPAPKKTTKSGKDDGEDILGTKRVSGKDESAMVQQMPTVMDSQRLGSVSRGFFEKFIDGFRPTATRRDAADAASARGVSHDFNVITAVVPFKKQFEHFEDVLANAEGYDAKRDQPNYLAFRIERAVVSGDPKAALDWQPLSTRNLRTLIKDVWGNATGQDIVDTRFTNEVLTFPLPPALFVKPTTYGGHSLVPNLVFKLEKEVKGKKPSVDTKRTPGLDLEMEAEPAATKENVRSESEQGGEPNAAQPVMELPGKAAPNEVVAGAAGGAVSGGAASKTQFVPVTYKLVRFIDMETEPGKTYRYRMQVMIEDPNHPREPSQKPADQILDTNVIARNRKLDAEEQASGRRVFWLESAWSEPSQASRTISDKHYYASVVRHERLTPTVENDRTVLTPSSEPAGTMLTSIWDFTRATEVPGSADVPEDPSRPGAKTAPSIMRGTVLNFSRDANVLRPDNLEIKVVRMFRFQTNAYVVDLRAADMLPWKREKYKAPNTKTPNLYVPSEVLLVDHNGNLSVRNELEDLDQFKRLSLEDEIATPSFGPQ